MSQFYSKVLRAFSVTHLGVKHDRSGIASLVTVDSNFVTELDPRHS